MEKGFASFSGSAKELKKKLIGKDCNYCDEPAEYILEFYIDEPVCRKHWEMFNIVFEGKLL